MATVRNVKSKKNPIRQDLYNIISKALHNNSDAQILEHPENSYSVLTIVPLFYPIKEHNVHHNIAFRFRVASKRGLYEVEGLNNFMDSLIPKEYSPINRGYAHKREDGSMLFGNISFEDALATVFYTKDTKARSVVSSEMLNEHSDAWAGIVEPINNSISYEHTYSATIEIQVLPSKEYYDYAKEMEKISRHLARDIMYGAGPKTLRDFSAGERSRNRRIHLNNAKLAVRRIFTEW